MYGTDDRYCAIELPALRGSQDTEVAGGTKQLTLADPDFTSCIIVAEPHEAVDNVALIAKYGGVFGVDAGESNDNGEGDDFEDEGEGGGEVGGSKPEANGHEYRPDIDGLRCIAVSTVVAFHYFPSSCPGGFVGVDVFFVISGYLITGILIRQHTNKTYTIGKFYERRVRRIFPTLLVCLVLTILASACIMTSSDFKQLGASAAYSTAFSSNLNAIRQLEIHSKRSDDDGGGGYFQTLDEESSTFEDPLLHLWSLGVEEQFYILWPLVLPWLIRRPAWVVALTVALFVCCLVVVYDGIASVDSSLAYYIPLTRGWELLIGALLAWLPAQYTCRSGATLDPYHRSKVVASGAGIVLLVASFVVIDEASLFPAWVTLLPTLGTAVLIAAGPGPVVNRAIGNPVFTAVGKVSYPVYLFHWPVLVLFRMFASSSCSDSDSSDREGGELSMSLRWVALAVSISLGVGTLLVVENPLRHLKQQQTPVVLSVMMLAVFAVSVCISEGLIAPIAVGFGPECSTPASLVTPIGAGEGRAMFPECLADVTRDTVLAATSKPLSWNYPLPHYKCNSLPYTPEHPSFVSYCELNPGQPTTVLVIGDSHSMQLHSRFNYLVKNSSLWATDSARPSVGIITASACSGLPGAVNVESTFGRDGNGDFSCCKCGDSSTRMLDLVKRWSDVTGHSTTVTAVVFAAFWDFELESMRYSATPDVSVGWAETPLSAGAQDILTAWRTTIESFVSDGVKVFAVEPPPTYNRGRLLRSRGGNLSEYQFWSDNGHYGPRRLTFGVDDGLVPSYADFLAPVNYTDFWTSTAYHVQPVLEVAEAAGATILHSASSMCLRGVCPMLSPGGYPALKDGDHYLPWHLEVYGGFLDEAVGARGAGRALDFCV